MTRGAAAASSRHLAASSQRRPSAGDEEARASLQERLARFSKLMFWSFLTLMVFLAGAYAIYKDLAPDRNVTIFIAGIIGLAIMGLTWRIVLVRRPLSLDALYRIDLMFAVGIGIVFGISSALSPKLPAASYTTLIYASFTVFMRAIVVPSSGRRTAVISGVIFFEVLLGGAYMIATRDPVDADLPGPMQLIGGAIFGIIAVALSATGSEVIYGLRLQVSAAMQLGQYTLGRKIGQGGMGAVYHAHHALLRRPTAIKLLQPDRVGAENLDRFEREVQHMSQLSHPNTVAVFDYGRSGGVLYYAMEYLGGIDLQALVKRFGPQPAGRVIHILTQVCGALQEAHTAGLVHRDIKPANIILCERGGVPDVAKVVDYGLVIELAGDPAASKPTSIMGTPGYIAPEAVTDPDRVGPSVDLYALGATAYFLLTGRRVFDAKTDAELCIQHVTAKPTPPSQIASVHVPGALEEAIMTCLAKAPGQRHASAAALARALHGIDAGDGWGPDAATAWWRDFHALAERTPTTDTPTLTVTVDLERRIRDDMRKA